nr:hypothetical protein [Mesobacillus harenae]
MDGSGIQPISPADKKNISDGYVVVDIDNCSPDHQILKEVYIPDRKRLSYQLLEKLFNNYALNQKDKENNKPSECKEIEEFLKMAIHSLPVKMAKTFIEKNSNKELNEFQWYTYLYDLWFRQFNCESGRDLSGFEHVFLGEQKRKRLVGHHYWYKYWLEDNLDQNKHNKDQIKMLCTNFSEPRSAEPHVVTLGYRLKAFDYEKNRFIDISKKKCAFFVGVSAEGLLALGTVRAALDEIASDTAVINNVNLKLELFKSPDGKSIRTFYPIAPS